MRKRLAKILGSALLIAGLMGGMTQAASARHHHVYFGVGAPSVYSYPVYTNPYGYPVYYPSAYPVYTGPSINIGF